MTIVACVQPPSPLRKKTEKGRVCNWLLLIVYRNNCTLIKNSFHWPKFTPGKVKRNFKPYFVKYETFKMNFSLYCNLIRQFDKTIFNCSFIFSQIKNVLVPSTSHVKSLQLVRTKFLPVPDNRTYYVLPHPDKLKIVYAHMHVVFCKIYH